MHTVFLFSLFKIHLYICGKKEWPQGYTFYRHSLLFPYSLPLCRKQNNFLHLKRNHLRITMFCYTWRVNLQKQISNSFWVVLIRYLNFFLNFNKWCFLLCAQGNITQTNVGLFIFKKGFFICFCKQTLHLLIACGTTCSILLFSKAQQTSLTSLSGDKNCSLQPCVRLSLRIKTECTLGNIWHKEYIFRGSVEMKLLIWP